MYKFLLLTVAFLLTVLMSSTIAGQTEELEKLSQDYIDVRSSFYPVWATSVGIFDYDSLLTDYSSERVFQYRNNISKIMQELRQINIKKLKGDDYINYKLLLSNIRYDEFILVKFPFYQHSTALYLNEVLNSLYYLLIDNSRTDEEKAPFLLARMKQIPYFFEQRWEHQPLMDKIFYEIVLESTDGGIELIEETAKLLFEVVPDSSRRIARYKKEAISNLKNLKMFCAVEIQYAPEKHFIGKENLDYLLKNIYFLDIDSDSLMNLGWYWYNKANAAMDSIQAIIDSKQPADDKEIPFDNSLTKDDIFQYYQREINETANFFKNHDIVSIPENIGKCIPVEMPAFMRSMHRGIAYQPPAPFSSDQTGYFYVRPIPTLDSAAIAKYSNIIQNKRFKSSVVHEAFPGHHLQLSIANNNLSPLRKIQDNTMMSEGWALYCEQMATEQGLFDNENLDERWLGVYSGIRFRAVQMIVDCSLADSSMTPDSALVFMNNMLGENTDYFTSEIKRYCAYPTQALSCLTGKLIILDILEKARKKEGSSFSLKAFHDRLLAEGTIPPSLIAKKMSLKK
ncbi:MAG: DUF885 domain-containing protein [candidate division Zixibacteria bacterium]|nr:DUF885 domain-containing protein [candidate division Zixibacteria bacterium]